MTTSQEKSVFIGYNPHLHRCVWCSRKLAFVVDVLIFLFLQGSSKRQILTLTARTLAGQFRDRLKASADSLLENALVM